MTWNSGTSVYKQWSGRIIGVAQYDKNTANYPIVVKLETGTKQDWFIGFNHAVGNNVDVKEAINEVSIYKVDGGNGNSYSHSFLKGYLQSGKDATITDWRNTGKSLVIQVDSINLNAVPAYADVTITFWPEGKPAPTRQPTRQPSRNPTRQPTVSLCVFLNLEKLNSCAHHLLKICCLYHFSLLICLTLNLQALPTVKPTLKPTVSNMTLFNLVLSCNRVGCSY